MSSVFREDKMTHFVQVVSNVLSKVTRSLETGSDLSDTIHLVEEELKQKNIFLGNIVRRWRKEPRLQDEREYKLLRIDGDKAFQEKKYDEALKKYR